MPFVPGYTHTPGRHCGSTALRNLLGFHGIEISEEMAFGLGAGACFYYLTMEDASPTRWFNGRTARLEENFDELTGAALELRTFEREYRTRLKTYLESQLEELGQRGSAAPVDSSASNDGGSEPDLVMAAAGDVPTLETLAAISILRLLLPNLKIRMINVVDLMKLQPQSEHPHGLPDEAFDALFTKNKPIIFAYHGYPWLIHRLAYRRTNHKNLHVRGYKEEGTITTPFDMTVLNDLDRFHLAQDAIRRLPRLAKRAPVLIQELDEKLAAHHDYIRAHGQDMPEVRDWRWPG